MFSRRALPRPSSAPRLPIDGLSACGADYGGRRCGEMVAISIIVPRFGTYVPKFREARFASPPPLLWAGRWARTAAGGRAQFV